MEQFDQAHGFRFFLGALLCLVGCDVALEVVDDVEPGPALMGGPGGTEISPAWSCLTRQPKSLPQPRL
jgi:hypothetical protein